MFLTTAPAGDIKRGEGEKEPLGSFCKTSSSAFFVTARRPLPSAKHPAKPTTGFPIYSRQLLGAKRKLTFVQLLVSETTRCCLFDPTLPIVWSGDPKKQNKNLKMEEKHIFPYMCLTLSQGADINFKKCCVSEIDDISHV